MDMLDKKTDWSFLWENLPPEFETRLKKLEESMESLRSGGWRKTPTETLKRFIQTHEKEIEKHVAKILEHEENLKFLNEVLKMLST